MVEYFRSIEIRLTVHKRVETRPMYKKKYYTDTHTHTIWMAYYTPYIQCAIVLNRDSMETHTQAFSIATTHILSEKT